MSNAANPDEVNIRERHARRDERKIAQGINYLLEDERGQDFLWWLLGEAYVFKTTFTGNSQGNFLEGQRNLGLIVYNRVIETNPESYLAMQLRKQKQAQSDSQELTNAAKGQDDD